MQNNTLREDEKRELIHDRALNACVNVYMSNHVSTVERLPLHVQECWKVGAEYYRESLRKFYAKFYDRRPM